MQPHPLKLFRAMRDLTLDEAGVFFSLDPSTILKIESGMSRTPEWMAEWLADPMMTEAEIQRRIDNARAKIDSRHKKRSTRGMNNPVYRWRKAMGLTQADAAKILGVHRVTLSKIELGDQPIPEKIFKIIGKEIAHESRANHG